MRIIITSILLLAIGVVSNAQEWHRNYRLRDNQQSVNLAGTQISGGDYVSIDGILKDSTFSEIFITRYDFKGTFTNTKKLSFVDQDSLEITLNGNSLFQAQNDSIYFTLTFFKDDEPNKFIGCVDADLNYAWGRVVNDNASIPQTEQGFNIASDFINNTIIQIANVGAQDPVQGISPTLIMSQIDYAGNTVLTRELELSVLNMNSSVLLTDIEVTQDTSILLTGIFNNTATYFICKLDSLFNPIFIRTYADDDSNNFLPIYSGLDIKENSDGELIVLGQFINFDLDPNNIYQGSFLAKHDTLGRLLWAKRIDFNAQFPNVAIGLNVENNGSLTYAANVIEEDFPVTILSRTDGDGNTQWTKAYNMVPSPLITLGDLVKTSDNGYAIFNTALIDTIVLGTNIIKTDDEGSTTCEDTINGELLLDISLLTDTAGIRLLSPDAIQLDGVAAVTRDFQEFAVPTIDLETQFFCPNEQINVLLEATIPGATSYEWSTGATTDTLRIFDDEQYSVTVTVADDVCFVLCDTVQMERYDLPSISGGFICVDGEYELIANPIAAAGVDSILWGTGQVNVNRIIVADQGRYQVTVVDQCGERASTVIDVNPSPPNFAPNFTCREDGIYLISDFSPDNTLSIMWSTGPQDDGKHEVLVTDKTTYTVTLTDICNETVVETVNVNPPPVAIDLSGECTEDGIFINAIPTGIGILSIVWSTGSNDDDKTRIEIPSTGLPITATYTDYCREEVTNMITFNPDPVRTDLTVAGCSPEGFTIASSAIIGEIASLRWSTGAQDDDRGSIVVPSGDYTVTVTDYCGLTSEASISIDELPDMVTITPDFTTACNNGPVTLSASVNTGTAQFVWNTNDSSSVISVNQIGTYTVTATDICGNMFSESITFDESDLPVETEAVQFIVDNSGFCETGTVTLIAQIAGGTNGVEWSTGSTEATIEVIPGEDQFIEITSLDDCGNETFSDSVDTDGNALQFPNIFFPRTEAGGGFMINNPENAFFGAYVARTDSTTYEQILDFELHIYNRWGQEVFNSNSVTDRWNGGINNNLREPAIPDVYIWWAEWRDEEGCSFNDKGDITLAR